MEAATKRNTAKTITFLSALLYAFSASSAAAQICIIQAPANYEFVDMGYDTTTNEVGIVGNVVENGEDIPTVFELNAEGDGFTAQTLADLPGATQRALVTAISSDAIRIAGTNLDSPNTVDVEGTTWLRSSPSNPIPIGTLSNTNNRSQALGAWANGVVGSSGGQNRSITWDANNGIQELPGTLNFITQATDVSENAEIIVGFSTHEVFDGAAYYWDTNGIHRLNDSIPGHTLVQSRANAVSPNGNYIAGQISAIDPQGTPVVYPAVWEGSERTLTVLADDNGNFLQGTTLDISDLGFAVGTFANADFTDSFGFIWQPEFGASVRVFEDWLDEIQPTNTFGAGTFTVNAIAEANGRLLFTVLDRNFAYALIDVTIDEPATIPAGLGDFNDDGLVDLLDLDMYSGNLDANAVGPLEALDLDNDGTVDADDFEFHLSSLVKTSNGRRGTFAGDANLDGSVDVLNDAFTLVGNLGQAATSFSQGDFNADGVVDVLGDAFLLVANLGMTNEPSSLCSP